MTPAYQFVPLGGSLFPAIGRARRGTDFQPGGREVRDMLDVTLVGEDYEQCWMSLFSVSTTSR